MLKFVKRNWKRILLTTGLMTSAGGIYMYFKKRHHMIPVYYNLKNVYDNKASLVKQKVKMFSPNTEYGIKEFLEFQRENPPNFTPSFLYSRGVAADTVLSLHEMRNIKLIDPIEGWTKIQGDPTVAEINGSLYKYGLEFPIDFPYFMPYLDIIHLNEYGFSALKFGTIQKWIGSLSITMPTGDQFTLNTYGVPNAHGANVGKYFL